MIFTAVRLLTLLSLELRVSPPIDGNKARDKVLQDGNRSPHVVSADTRHNFNKPKSIGGAHQHNGDISTDTPNINSPGHNYEEPSASDGSTQTNGNISGLEAIKFRFAPRPQCNQRHHE